MTLQRQAENDEILKKKKKDNQKYSHLFCAYRN